MIIKKKSKSNNNFKDSLKVDTVTASAKQQTTRNSGNIRKNDDWER